MINVKKGDFIQLFKMKYYICDQPYENNNGNIKELVLIEIPNGLK